MKWEYLVVSASQTASVDPDLERRGLEGWEAVGIIGLPQDCRYRVLMKRKAEATLDLSVTSSPESPQAGIPNVSVNAGHVVGPRSVLKHAVGYHTFVSAQSEECRNE